MTGSLVENIDQFKVVYHDLLQQYDQLKRNYQLYGILSEGGVAKLFERADHIKQVADRMNASINSEELKETLNRMARVMESIDNDGTFQWVSSPIEPLKDVIIFDVDIRKKEGDRNGLFYTRKFRHHEFIRGGTRFDLGLGLAASYFSNSPDYELAVEGAVDSLSKITIQQKNDHLFVPSLVGLATVSRRSPTYFTYGGSAGLGIDVINGKIEISNFFAGPTLVIGKFDRLALTLGGSVRNVRTLKAGYEVGQVINGNADDINNFRTDKYKVGGFVALTYNLTSGLKKNLEHVKSFY